MAEITIIPAKNHADEIVRTAAYARVSSDSEDQLNSFAAQIRYYTELLQNSTDAVFVDMYADQGITGTSAAKRTEFQRLMSDSAKGKSIEYSRNPYRGSRETPKTALRLCAS